MSVINRVKLREASIGFLKKSRSFKPTPNTVAIAGRSHVPSVKKGLGEKPSLRLRNSIVARGKLLENTAMDRFIAKNYVPGVGPNKKAKKVVDNLKLKSNPLFDYFDVLQGRLRGKMMNPKLESSIVERANLREAGITDIAAQRERLHKLKLRLLKSSVKKSYPVSDPKDYRPNATTGRYTHKVSSDFPHATVTDHKMGTVSYADPDMVKEQHRREVFPEWYKESSIISRGILREAALFGGMKKTNLPISDKVKSPDLRMKRKAKKSELPVAKSGEVYDPSWLYGMKNPYNN